MSITDYTSDDNTKTTVGGNATDKDHQPNSMADTEERNKYNRKSANNIDYSAERVLGHVIEKEEDKPEEERTQTRSSDRLRKQKEASQAEDKERNRREMESYVPPKEDKKRDGQPKTEGEESPTKKAKVSLSVYVCIYNINCL